MSRTFPQKLADDYVPERYRPAPLRIEEMKPASDALPAIAFRWGPQLLAVTPLPAIQRH